MANQNSQNLPAEQSTTKPLPIAYIDRIFERFSRIYGHKFDSAYKTPEAVNGAKAEWADSLCRMSAFQIGSALGRCKNGKDGWPPGIGEFIDLALNIPSLAVATERTMTGEAIDMVSLGICQRLGFYELRNRTTEQLEKRIRGIYPDVRDEVIEDRMGAETEWAPPIKIEHKAEPETPPTEVEKAASKSVGEVALLHIKNILN